MNLVIFGAPGAGNGTLAGKIKAIMPIVHVSTGDLLRDNVSKKTPIGLKAKTFMDAGKLVPDDVVIGMVKERLSQADAKKNGVMMDGFPRTLDQAKALDAVVKLERVIVIDITKNELEKRILGRRTCPKCNRIYNIYNPQLKPKKEGVCDDCKEKLTQRADDNKETFEKRWSTYLSQSQDVIKYYEARKGLVKHVNGSNTMGLTENDIKALLK
jgi:adenylate kinase